MNKDTRNTILIGSIILAVIVYYSIVNFFRTHLYLSIIIIIFLVALLAFLIKYSYQHEEFRQKELSFLKGFLIFLSDFLKHSESKNKKQRVPIPESVKIKVFERAGHRCQICISETDLRIHHIDKNPSNNSMNNLIVLCPTHHAEADRDGIRKEQLKARINKQTRPGKIAYVQD